MSTSTRLSVRAVAALLAFATLFAYDPSRTAQAEPAFPAEARAAGEVESSKRDVKNTPALPGRADENTSGSKKDPNKEGASREQKALGNEAHEEKPAPPSKKLMLTIPRLGLKDVKVGDSSEQSYLNRERIMHLSGTGFPYQKGSNTYIAAHALGYANSRVRYAFRDLEEINKGDRVTVRDAAGKVYKYRVYKRMIVDSDDFWATKPVEGRKIISLQTCWHEPSFEKRLIVRAELVR